MKESIADQVVKIIAMYESGEDWQSYLHSLKNKEEIQCGIYEMLGETSITE